MSHFTRVKTQITDREMLVKALADLKYSVSENATVRGYQGDKLQAEVVVRPGGGYDIGFERGKDGSYQVVADWWGVENEAKLSTKAFVEPVTQRYAYHKVVAEVAKQGFQVVQEQSGADQTLKVTVRRWS
ncbi:MAG: hypothetical protein JWM80_1656 [Cyanobacteria bacterium RYN_339]|nr:hypothetical protein [Cyanobacteria bacterium RYN_339]